MWAHVGVFCLGRTTMSSVPCHDPLCWARSRSLGHLACLPWLRAAALPAHPLSWRAEDQCPQALPGKPQGSPKLSSLHHPAHPVTPFVSLRLTASLVQRMKGGPRPRVTVSAPCA